MNLYEQTRKNPKTGFKETIFSHDKFVPGWRFTGKVVKQ